MNRIKHNAGRASLALVTMVMLATTCLFWALPDSLRAAPGGNVTAAQGSPAPTASAWPVTIVSGGSGGGTVTQGPPGPTSSPWPVTIVSGGSGGGAVTQSGTWTVGISAAQTLATVTTVGSITTLPAITLAGSQTLATVTTVGAVTAITNALPAGTNVIGKVGIDQTTDGTTNGVANRLSNGTTWDPALDNVAGTLLASAAQGSINSADQTNTNARGVTIFVNPTVNTTTIAVSIQVKDPVSGNYYTVLTVSVPGSSTTMLVGQIGPGLGSVSGQTASWMLGRTWRVSTTVGAGTPTYSVGYCLQL